MSCEQGWNFCAQSRGEPSLLQVSGDNHQALLLHGLETHPSIFASVFPQPLLLSFSFLRTLFIGLGSALIPSVPLILRS